MTAPAPPHAGRRTRLAAASVAAIVLLTLSFVAGIALRSRPAGPGVVDVGFAQDMSVHHDQAVLMANLAVTHGTPAVRGIAGSILVGQSQEIGQLRGWLQLWGRPIADPHPMAWMPAAPAMPGMAAMSGDAPMPGMASPRELATLYSLSGKRFDVLFMQLMIRHHQGGIEMAHFAETHARTATVRSAATAMRVEQVEDLAIMQPLLAADGGKQLPAPTGA
jgi:uncharacterized protein (DUF305 family)